MEIRIDEKTHTYFVDGDIASISVTELLKKHGLAPDYSGVSKKDLSEKAEEGRRVHKDLELILNERNHTPTTPQGEQFRAWVKENIDCAVGEQKLAYEYNGMTICGTADVMGLRKDGVWFIADHKNMSKINKEYVSWQVSLLDYMARKIEGRTINGSPFMWHGAVKFYCFQYTPEFKLVELEKVDDTEIERLIEAEYNHEIYKRPALVVDDELSVKFKEAERALIRIQEEEAAAKERAEELRALILSEMEKQGIKSWKTDEISVTYVAQQERISTDTAELKRHYPQIFARCQKISKVKAYLRITRKDDEF